MSLWLRRRDLRTLLYIAIVIKFLATFEYTFILFLLIFLLDSIVVMINLIQLLAAILIRINYLSIYLSISQHFFTFKIKKKLMISYNWFWVVSLTMKSKKNCFSHRLLQINAGLSNKGLGVKNFVIIIVVRCLVLLLNLTCSTVFHSPLLTALTARVISSQAVFLWLFVTELQTFDLRTTYNPIKMKLYILVGF